MHRACPHVQINTPGHNRYGYHYSNIQWGSVMLRHAFIATSIDEINMPLTTVTVLTSWKPPVPFPNGAIL